MHKQTDHDELATTFGGRVSRWTMTSVLAALLLGMIAVSGWRVIQQHQIPGPFNPARQGFCDFHNGVYFPSLAFSHRVSPYSQNYAQSYPVERSIPFFSPSSLAFHLPFALLPMSAAEPIYFAWMILLILLISKFVADQSCRTNVRRWLGFSHGQLLLAIAIGLIVSRGGQQTLFTGYFTFELILATLLAVHYSGSRPWISGFALAWVAIKPNFILPIGLLLLSRGHWRPLVIGAGLSMATALASFAWILPEGGFSELLAQIQETQTIHRLDAMERPTTNWTRVDVLAVLAKWSGSDPSELVQLASMFVLLLPAMIVIAVRRWRSRSEVCSDSVGEIEGCLILLTSLIAVYHQVYDCLLLVAGVTALCLCPTRAWPRLHVASRAMVLFCLLFPSLNYLSSQKLLTALSLEGSAFQLVTSLNTIALVIAWCIMLFSLVVAMRGERHTQP